MDIFRRINLLETENCSELEVSPPQRILALWLFDVYTCRNILKYLHLRLPRGLVAFYKNIRAKVLSPMYCGICSLLMS